LDHTDVVFESSRYGTHPRDVFICYSSEDVAEAERVAARLELHEGLSCWYEARNAPKEHINNISFILDMVEQCAVFLLLTSAHSATSLEVQFMVSHAMAENKDRVEFNIDNKRYHEQAFSDSSYALDTQWDKAVFTLSDHVKRIKEAPKEETDPEEEVIASVNTGASRAVVLVFVLLIGVIGGVITFYTLTEGPEYFLRHFGPATPTPIPPPTIYERAQRGEPRAQYEHGRNLMSSQRFDEAIDWIKKAAQQDYFNAQAFLAESYRDGYIVQRDYWQAIYWFYRAGVMEMPEMQYYVGQLYEFGLVEELERDYEMAAYWYMHSARNGFLQAQMTVAWLSLDGQILPYDIDTAIYWFRQAAMQGHPNAYLRLGQLLGYIGHDNLEEAIYWLTRAADAGETEAHEILEQLYTE